jgi:hypothetical protein
LAGALVVLLVRERVGSATVAIRSPEAVEVDQPNRVASAQLSGPDRH